ncbi:hypothetical protein [Pseudonocardia lacus]|uniref:hypothetical protein n=1 Tax=Pseudonocardia lacus TaxID=2835865 RepID=UPI001BDCF818|nr:hypothetical protein [Pseudonocardia lacus]
MASGMGRGGGTGPTDGDDALVGALRQVVVGYGPHAPGDPVALRSALRLTCPDLPVAEAALLVAVARSGVVEDAGAVARRGGRPDREAAVRAVRGSSADLPVVDVRRALVAFGTVLGLDWEVRDVEPDARPEPGEPAPATPARGVAHSEPTVDVPRATLVEMLRPTSAGSIPGEPGPTSAGPGVERSSPTVERPRPTAAELRPAVGRPSPSGGGRISWDERTRPTRRPAPAPAPTRRRGPWIVAAVLVVLVVGAVAVLVAVLRGADDARPAAAPDRFAPDQVALRYRALGADLLAGALRCADLGSGPGLAEVVTCDFGGWALVLTEYETADGLRDVRDLLLSPRPESARSASRTAPGAAFLMDQDRDGTTRVYWDVESPRPVSAVASTTALTMAELVEAFDDRGFTALQRPPQPGAPFDSPALWEFASGLVTNAGGTCTPRPTKDAYATAAEQVDCDFAGGAEASYVLFADPQDLAGERAGHVSPLETVPNTHRTGSYGSDAVFADYVLAADGEAYVYYDRGDLATFALVWQDGQPLEQVRAFWEQNHG